MSPGDSLPSRIWFGRDWMRGRGHAGGFMLAPRVPEKEGDICPCLLGCEASLRPGQIEHRRPYRTYEGQSDVARSALWTGRDHTTRVRLPRINVRFWR